MNKAVFDVKEAAKYLGVCPATIYSLCKRTDFPAVRVSPRRIIFPVDALNRWLEDNAGKAIY